MSFTFSQLQAAYNKYIQQVNNAEKWRNYICIGTSVGAFGVWCYRKCALEYLPSLAVVCGHNLINHTTVYYTYARNVSSRLFKHRNFRNLGYRYLFETGIYMAADYAVIKWLSPRFMPVVHKYIIRMRYIGLTINCISVLAVGTLYIPQVQNYIVKTFANSIRRAPLLVGLIQGYSGLQVPKPTPIEQQPKIPYSAIADLVPTDCRIGDSTCGICMQDSQTIIHVDNTQLTKTRTCGHLFCVPCIEAWLNIGSGESVQNSKYCPMCRTPIISLADLPTRTIQPPNDGLEAHIRYMISNFPI
jgi:hypothetical protein